MLCIAWSLSGWFQADSWNNRAHFLYSGQIRGDSTMTPHTFKALLSRILWLSGSAAINERGPPAIRCFWYCFFCAGESRAEERISDSAGLVGVSCHACGHPDESKSRRSLWIQRTQSGGAGSDGGTYWGYSALFEWQVKIIVHNVTGLQIQVWHVFRIMFSLGRQVRANRSTN